MNINKPKKLLEFITLPQCIMAVLLTLVFIRASEYPNLVLIVIFIFELLVNIAVVIYYIRNKSRDDIGIKALYAFLASFLVIFTCGVFYIFDRLSFISVISPETIYLLCNSVSLIFLSTAIIKQTSPENKPNLTVLVSLCLALPVAVYLLLESSYTLGDVSIVLAIGLVCVFLFLLGKLAFILYIRFKKPKQAENIPTGYSNKYLIFVAVTAVLLPQAGLTVNNYTFFNGILGDFRGVWFHIIAALNGLLLLIDINKTKHKLPLFYLKASGFSFISYFTLIFIPYMPYAIIGILIYGLGLLVYVPAVVCVVQIKQLHREITLLKNLYQKHIVILTAIIGFLTLPALLALNFTIDRENFNNAMSYVNTDHNIQQEVSVNRLKRSLNQIESTMLSVRRQGGLTFMPGTPGITSAYRYIALDNMYFTEDTLAKLRKIFMPETIVGITETMWSEPEPNHEYDTKLSISEIAYDSVSGSYRAWIDFEITQISGNWLGEYRTKFALPDGCFITDYYLYVGSEKKRGIITDKRAAQVAYESIIRTPRDPGIVYYDNDDTIALRVYPFSGQETRRTGVQVMFSQNETLQIEGQSVYLTADNPVTDPIIMDGGQFIPYEYKKTLPFIERQPLYYFLLDAGDASPYRKHLEKAKQYAKDKSIDSRYYAVSYQVKEITDLTAAKPDVPARGGFNTAYAMSGILSSVPDGYFPVIFLVTENMNRSLPLEKTRLTTAFPEIYCYYRLNDDFSLTPYRFSDSERLRDVKEPGIIKALNYNGTAVGGEKSETIITNASFSENTNNPYINAFILQKNTFLADTNESQVLFIKESMKQRVLTKNTAFIVMETKEQENLLLSLQELFLSGKSEETPSVMMSEPAWAAIFVILGLVFLWKRIVLLQKSKTM